jgi:hypothetical protein
LEREYFPNFKWVKMWPRNWKVCKPAVDPEIMSNFVTVPAT